MFIRVSSEHINIIVIIIIILSKTLRTSEVSE